jgi:hypothetical protein
MLALNQYDLHDSVMGETVMGAWPKTEMPTGWPAAETLVSFDTAEPALHLASWGVEEVVHWLTHVVGIPQYTDAIRRMQIDGYGLLRLSADMSGRETVNTQLGITDRVHRGRFLSAIRKLELANCRKRELQAGQQVGTVRGNTFTCLTYELGGAYGLDLTWAVCGRSTPGSIGAPGSPQWPPGSLRLISKVSCDQR